LEVLGPEHEYSLVDEQLRPLPIVDQVIKAFKGRVVNVVSLNGYSLGKELQAHVAELKANTPFPSPVTFEEQMHKGVQEVTEFVGRKYTAQLLGTGMHPLLDLDDAQVWPHRGRKLFAVLDRLFNLHQHGWLNIQSFQLNLSYGNEGDAIRLHNQVARLLPYLPAVAAASPVYEATVSDDLDSRLRFYWINQRAVPSITGDVIPEVVHSFHEYRRSIIARYSEDLQRVGAPDDLLHREWMNSRGAIFRFDRRALEIRIMDEQECVKADVALSCFIRACLRGMLLQTDPCVSHSLLVQDLLAVIKDGLDAPVQHPHGPTARDVCTHYYRLAEAHASEEEKAYLPLVKTRIEKGSLSNLIRRAIQRRAQKTALSDAITHVYLQLAECLTANRMYA
jgi:gamma-glutamyl:cysteine ligase YbdK (ATP-grasp superfamily)